jgi:hypothetical protein
VLGSRFVWSAKQYVAAACVATLAVALAGCSVSEFIQDLTPAPAADLSQPNHRRVVADNIKTVFPHQSDLGQLEISEARQVEHLKGPAWLTCLKLDARGAAQHYAIFIQGNKIVDTRAGIVMDQCHKQAYTPLEISNPNVIPIADR